MHCAECGGYMDWPRQCGNCRLWFCDVHGSRAEHDCYGEDDPEPEDDDDWVARSTPEFAALTAENASLRTRLAAMEGALWKMVDHHDATCDVPFGRCPEVDTAMRLLSPEAPSPASGYPSDELSVTCGPAPPAPSPAHEPMGANAPQWCATCSAGKPMAEWVPWPCGEAAPSRSQESERIVASAIQQDGVTFTGPHHHQIIRYLAPLTGRPVRGEQGFITDRNRFVSRREAAALVGAETDLLFSEQLWEVTDAMICPHPAPTPEAPPARDSAPEGRPAETNPEEELWEVARESAGGRIPSESRAPEAPPAGIPLKDWPEHKARMVEAIRRSEKLTGSDLAQRIGAGEPPTPSGSD